MKHRLLVICAVMLLTGCAAFDSGGEPFEGFSPDQIPAPKAATGPNTGYFTGDMTLSSNSCESVSDKVGAKAPLSLDVVEASSNVSVTFEDGKVASGSLSSDKATVMTDTMGVKHVYYLEFSKDALKGNIEVLEENEAKQYADPCATYDFELKRGEKPAVDAGEKK